MDEMKNNRLDEFFDEEETVNEVNDFGKETKAWPLTVITVIILAIIALLAGAITYISTASRLEKNKKETIDRKSVV